MGTMCVSSPEVKETDFMRELETEMSPPPTEGTVSLSLTLTVQFSAMPSSFHSQPWLSPSTSA